MKRRTALLLVTAALCLAAAGFLLYRSTLHRFRRPAAGHTTTTFRNTAQPPAELHTVSDTLGSINAYFNKSALNGPDLPGPRANCHVNLETRLIHRLNGAERTIDMALYELNLPRLTDALLNRAAAGIRVRILADAKKGDDPHYVHRYRLMRVHLERLARGRDGICGTADDVTLFADSPIFALTDSTYRVKHGLPARPDGFPVKALKISRKTYRGPVLALGERKKRGNRNTFYAPDAQMHNKFAIIDTAWVWTGSWNFTVTGLYGSRKNMKAGILGGNTQACVELHSPALATVYGTEFAEMWGGTTAHPDPARARFHGRKKDNTLHRVPVGGRLVEVYFSPGDNAVDRITELVGREAHHSARFSIFAWSSQGLADMLKRKWETSAVDFEGKRTAFTVAGVFDESFWNQWWSASVDLGGRTASRTSEKNPNIRWRYPAPVFPDAEDRKMHAKTMILDAGTDSDPTVITGSLNWSVNGQDINDENVLFIHDADITDQFMREFGARYRRAGGVITP